ATARQSTLSLHDALPICDPQPVGHSARDLVFLVYIKMVAVGNDLHRAIAGRPALELLRRIELARLLVAPDIQPGACDARRELEEDRKSTRLNSSHSQISY